MSNLELTNLKRVEFIKKVDDILPQTQCRRCGYPSCLDYATALVDGDAEINQCPPGGDLGISKLALVFNKPIMPLNPENGVIKPRAVVVIDEDACIGCTLCIKACPVDAILGSNKQMHTVIESECTGCDLCIPACPVDCITTKDADNKTFANSEMVQFKNRFLHRNYRTKRDIEARESRLKNRSPIKLEN
jgi:electron transport complex protein RnfB